MRVDKTRIIAALRARLRENLNSLTAAQGAAQSGATHEQTRQEDPKDTRAIEAAYLARGLAERVETMRSEIAVVGTMQGRSFSSQDSIAMGALVGLKSGDEEEAVYFLTPCGGGEKITVDGIVIQVLTTTSPLGAAVIEKRVGDEIELVLPTRRLEAVVSWIA